MAVKARFYKVQARNVRETYLRIVPEMSKEHAKSVVDFHEVVVDDEPIWMGWHEVKVITTSEGIAFEANVNGDTFVYIQGDAGYEYLKQQFKCGYLDEAKGLY